MWTFDWTPEVLHALLDALAEVAAKRYTDETLVELLDLLKNIDVEKLDRLVLLERLRRSDDDAIATPSKTIEDSMRVHPSAAQR